MSKSLTVRLTLRRSSARRAPISYTPPVKPPPPSTSAVRERRSRRLWSCLCPFLLEARLGPTGPLGVASSSTTSPTVILLYTRQKPPSRLRTFVPVAVVLRPRRHRPGPKGRRGGNLDDAWRAYRTGRVLHGELGPRPGRVDRARQAAD